MPKTLNKIEILSKKIQKDTLEISYSEITEQLGVISIATNGKISCDLYPDYSHYEEYYLWNILCFCLEKKFITLDIPRIRLELSADSEFPSNIQTIIENNSFKTLNLISLRRSLPFDFWKYCSYFSVHNGQVQWKHSITVSPQMESSLNYHRLKAIGKKAEKQDPDTLQIKQLYLWNQALTQLPSELSCLNGLERLEIWNNPIEKFPSSFQNLQSLSTIILSKDQQHLVPSIQKYLPHTAIGWV